MSYEREIELDVDAVFPPPGARSGMIRRPEVRPPSTPPLPTLPPPPPGVEAAEMLGRIQEDVDLVIEATSRRLDDTTQRIDEFERTVRGVLGAQERRLRELETQLYETQRRVAELGADLERETRRADELHARNVVAMARIEMLERAPAPPAGPSAPPSDLLSLSAEIDDRESTQKLIRS